MKPACLLLATWGDSAAVFGAVAVCYMGLLGIIWKLFDHVNHAEKHPDKADIVFRAVCETKHQGETRTWQAELDVAKARIDGLKEQVQQGFDDVKHDVAEIKSLLLQSGGHKP